MDDWQALVLEVGMGERRDNRWAASDVDVIASRQNGKNGTIEARELYGAVILGESIIHTAHLFKTTKESYNRLLSLVEADPDVKERLTWQVASPASGYEMRFSGGGRVQFIARSRTSGRGLTGDLLVFDEAQDLDDDAVGALLPTLSARPNPQTWYLGSAPGPMSSVWQRRRRAGRNGGSPRVAFFEFSADPDCDLDDRKAWEQANPGLPERITLEAIEAERLALSDEMFARERLSVSADVVDADAVIPAALWQGCSDEGSEIVGPMSFAVDVSPDRSAAIAVAGSTADGHVHVEVVQAATGTSWVVPRLTHLLGRWGGEVALDPAGPAGSLLPEIRDAGITPREITLREHAQACGALVDAVSDGKLRHIDQGPLNSAVTGAAQRQVGDVWLWSRKSSSVDVSPLVAVTIAFGTVRSDTGGSGYYGMEDE